MIRNGITSMSELVLIPRSDMIPYDDVIESIGHRIEPNATKTLPQSIALWKIALARTVTVTKNIIKPKPENFDKKLK